MSAHDVAVAALLADPRLASLNLRVVAGEGGLGRRISNPRIQKPGLALAGYLAYVKAGRVQVIGQSEAEFLETLSPALAAERVAALAALEPPAIVVAKGLESAVATFAASCRVQNVPLLVSAESTSVVIGTLSTVLEYLLAPRETRHGDLLDIFAIGVLILGDSGSGKSECALELVHRGHRLVADDVVEIFRVRGEELVGQAPESLRGFMEVRGLGIISIEQLFGVVVVRDSKPIDMVIRLVPEATERLERLGLVEDTEELMGLKRPRLTVPVAPGRSLALLVECAARKHLLAQRKVQDKARDYLERHDRALLER